MPDAEHEGQKLSLEAVNFILQATEVGLNLLEDRASDPHALRAVTQIFRDIREEFVRAQTVGGPCYKCKAKNLNNPDGYQECLLTCF